MYIYCTMPDRKISEFDTFDGKTGSDVYFIVASGDAENVDSSNYKVPFNDLRSHLGIDPGGVPIFRATTEGIYFGGVTNGDSRKVSIQQSGQDVGVFDEFGNFILQNSLYCNDSISGLLISGTSGIFADKLLVSGVDILSELGVLDLAAIETASDAEKLSGNFDNFSGECLADFAAISNDLSLTGHILLSYYALGQKWSGIEGTDDIYFNQGKVGIQTDLPQSELDVSGSIFSQKVKAGDVTMRTDSNDNLVFDWDG